MSQRSFLDDITKWSRNDCLQNIDEAFPKLIHTVLDSDHADVEECLKIICDRFLPVCPVQQLERKIFSQVKRKILDTSHKIFSEVLKITGHCVDEAKSQISELLQIHQKMIGVVDQFVSCVKAVDVELRLEHIRSLPSVVLQMLHDSYSHCKDSSQIYGDLLTVVNEPLTALFKKAYALQLNFLSLLDELHITSSSDTDVTELCEIILRLHQLSVIAVSLDVKVMIVLWKTISRLTCQHKDVLMNQLDVDKMLSSLAEDMESSLTYQVQILTNSTQHDQTMFTKMIKVLGFQMKVLTAIVKEYECVLAESIDSIISLMLTIQSVSPPSVKSMAITGDQQTELYKHVGVALEPLISYLIPNINFIMTLTRVNKEIRHWSALCMVLITIVKLLPNYPADTQTAWINPKLYPEDEIRNPVLKAIFCTVPHCYAELCLPASLPGIMCRGEPQRNVTLYHHLCTHLCIFIASLPAQHFPVIEDCLLENVFSSNLHNALLATDVWCFVVRYGSAELCRDHCFVLAELLQKIGNTDSIKCCHLANALRRLTKFLAPEHVEQFISRFPLESNFPLYGAVAFSAFSDEQLEAFTDQLLPSCIAAVRSWTRGNSHRVSEARRMADVYKVLCNLLKTKPTPSHVSVQLQTLIQHSITCMLSLPCTASKQYQPVQLTAAGILEFLAYNVEYLDNMTLYKVLSELSEWLKCNSLESVVKVAAAYFLFSLGKKVFPPDNMQTAILRVMPRLFSTLLADSNPLIQQVALENFSQFAEETAHETIVPESLQYDEQTQTKVVSYLSLLSRGQLPNGINYSLLKSYQDILDKNSELSSEDLDESSSPADEPPNKKCKLDKTEDEISKQCHEALQLLEAGTDQLRSAIAKGGKLPKPCMDKICGIQSQLTEFLSKS